MHLRGINDGIDVMFLFFISNFVCVLWILCRFLFQDLPEEGGLIPEPTTILQDKKQPDSTDAPLESPKPG